MARRNRGIFERKNREGFWYRDYRGGRDQWIKLGVTRRDANRALDRLLAQSAPPSRITVAQAAGRWIASAVATRRSPRFAKETARVVKAYLEPRLGMRPLAMLTREDLRAYRLELDGKGLAPQTVKNILSDLRAFLLWCVDAGFLDRSPFPRRLMPAVPESTPDPLTNDELAALATLPERYGFAVRFLLDTGLRWSEACRAQAAHIERGLLVLSNTKSGRIRRVPLGASTMAEIRDRVGRLVPFVHEGSFNRAVKSRTGVRFTAHRCRDTFACRLLEAGMSLAALQELLGHQSVTTTQRYARLSEHSVLSEWAAARAKRNP